MRRPALFGLAIFLAAIAIANLAQNANSGPARVPAPNFAAQTWFNSPPLTLKRLRGKVVLVDFWEYTCINCIRTFPYLRRWNQLYAPDGLVIIGVHTPEFDFGKNPALVKDAAHRFGLTFPIAVDSDRKIWDAFSNEAWPADYLIDKDGYIVFSHYGEGDYADMEGRIQALLKQANPRLDFAAAKYKIPEDQPMLGGVCQRPTPELYIGSERADHMANFGGYVRGHPASYKLPDTITLDAFALDGNWLAMPWYVERAGGDGAAQSSLDLHYLASSVYLVAGTDGPDGKLYVTQDGKPVVPEARGVDVKQDSRGATYIQLGKKRMYYVVKNPQFGAHMLVLSAASPKIALYSFTFGNNCENPFDHR